MSSSKSPPAVGGSDRFSHLRKIADCVTAFRPGSEVLTAVRAVPTIFPQFDFITRVGGLPIERITLVHGPSSEGKTAFAIGLLSSFLRRNDFAVLLDAERTAPITWLAENMGDLAQHPFLKASRPESYECAVDDVRLFCRQIREGKEAGTIPSDTSGVVVVDSIKRLQPENLLKKILKEGASGEKGSIDGMGGRAGQYKAALNNQWMEELVPLLESCGCAAVLIARESEDPNADPWAKKTGNDYRVSGGKAIFYDASLVLRIERASYVSDTRGEDKKIYGERHKIVIRKTKVSKRVVKQPYSYFHTSNGTLIPPGFDRARDVLELAADFGVTDCKGNWIRWKKYKWQGVHQAVKALTANPGDLNELETQVREQFPSHTAKTLDEETGD